MNTLYLLAFTHADGLILGAAMATALMRGWAIPRFNPWIMYGLSVILGLYLVAIGPYNGGEVDLFWSGYWNAFEAIFLPLAVSLCCAWFVLLAVGPKNAISSFYEKRVLRWFGRLCYGLYVLHGATFLLVIDDRFLRMFPFLGSVNGRYADILLLPTMLGMSCIAALLSWHLLEKPFLNLKRRFAPN